MTTWPAPAKLNLFLHIVGRRPDGYHLLQTVFQFIDFCDTLTFAPRDDGRISRGSGPVDVPADQDLTVRAARLLQQQAGWEIRFTRYAQLADLALPDRLTLSNDKMKVKLIVDTWRSK